MSTYNTIISELEKANAQSSSTVYIPSINSSVPFKKLNVKSQKDIIKSALSSDGTNVTFNLHANELIYNCTDVRGLLVTDRPSILISLRRDNITDIIERDNIKIDLNTVIDSASKVKPPKHTDSINVDNITVFVKIPDLETDTKFLTACQKNITGLIEQDQVGDSVSMMYVYELAKIVDRVQFKSQPALSGSDEQDMQIHTVRFADMQVADCVSMVELLPASINAKMVEFISKIREYEEQVSTDPVTSTPIPVDVTLFTLD